MTYLTVLFIAAFAWAAPTNRQSTDGAARQAAIPTADQILDRYVEAHGGGAAIRAQAFRVMKGTLAVPAMGLTGTIESYAKLPNKQLTVIVLPGIGTLRTGFDGTSAWSAHDNAVEDVAAFPRREADFHLPVAIRTIYPRLTVIGRERVGDRDTYCLEAPRGGSPKRWWFDAGTGLLLRTEARGPNGNVVRREDYDDYRVVDGVRLPYVVRTLDALGQSVTTWREISHGGPIDDATFSKPIAAASAAPPPIARAPGYPGLVESLKADIPARMRSHRIPGLAIALVDRERVVWAEGFGVTEASGRTPVTPDTLFNVASVSKTYVATAFLIAVARGLVGLDDPVSRIDPTFTIQSRFGDGARLTWRHVLSHHASLPREAPLGNLFDDRPATFDAHVRSLAEAWLVAPIGSRYNYSNAGFDLAAHALELAAGTDLPRFMQTALFAPLQMTSSTFDPDVARRHPSRAVGHAMGREAALRPTSELGAGGMYSTLRDMARFLTLHVGGGEIDGTRLLPAALLKEMATPQFAIDDQMDGYGLGIGVSRWLGTTLLAHNGGGSGFHAWQGWVPEYRVGVVVVANALTLGDFTVDEIGRNAITGMVEVAGGRLSNDPPLGSWKTPKRSVSTTDLRRLEGTYSAGGAASLPATLATVKIVDGDLVYTPAAGPFGGVSSVSAPLTAHSPTEFMSNGERFRFRVDSDGRVEGVWVQDRATTGVMYLPLNDRPDDPKGPDKPEWRAWLGTYSGKIIGIGNEIPIGATVVIRNGHLYVGWGTPLRAIEHTPGLFFRSDGEAVRFEAGRLWLGNRPFVKIG